MRQIVLKTTDNQRVSFNSNNTSLMLNQEQPYGVGYRKPCSSTLTETELNNWWNYVDQLLIERATPNFHSVWRIIDNNVIYGFEN
jgi:hypothetical protein